MKSLQAAIIGTGHVGSTIAFTLLIKNLFSHILLADIAEEKCRGELMDLRNACNVSHSSHIRQISVAQASTADVIIICAGKAQQADQSREALLNSNVPIITTIFNELGSLKKDTIIVMVTNPVDTLTYHAIQQKKLPATQIIGSGTYLDTQRAQALLQEELGIDGQSVEIVVIGQHGQHQVPVWSSAAIHGKPLNEFARINQTTYNTLTERIKRRAYDIIDCKGYTNWGIASCVANICQAITLDQKKIFPLSTYLEEQDVCISIPAVIGAHGIESSFLPTMNQQEAAAFEQATETLKQLQSLL